MAASQIAFRTSLWHDPTWTGLTGGAQWLYFTIVADRWTDPAGIAPICLGRWASSTADKCANDVGGDLVALAHGGRAVIDYNAGWILLPKLFADSGSDTQPNRIKGAIAAAKRCDSTLIRSAFADVIAQLDPDQPAMLKALGRARPSRRPISPTVRLAVYQRDQWTCQDCGHTIRPSAAEHEHGLSAPYDETGWLELDHIHPWSDGGGDTEDNLRALCTPCNRIKGARLLLDVVAAAAVSS